MSLDNCNILKILFQIQKVVLALGDYLQAQCHACIGGTNVRDDKLRLSQGVHTIVGTPGRVHDMIQRGYLSEYCLFFLFFSTIDIFINIVN